MEKCASPNFSYLRTNNGFKESHSSPLLLSSSSSSSPSSTLSKFCAICGDNALHNFYGAISCDACRVSSFSSSADQF